MHLQETDAPWVGNAGLEGEAIPALQMVSVPYDVTLYAYLFAAVPQAPPLLMMTFAQQLAFVPPFVPLQNHVHGPVPETLELVPLEHRFVVGAAVRFAPFEVPQVPSTITVAVQLASVPPFVPLQNQVHGPVPANE